jgi:glycerol kinase
VKDFVLALDQGTSSCRALVFGRDSRVRALAQEELGQSYPRPGWVEQDAAEIWERTLRVGRAALERAGITGKDVAAVGITNQRETTVLWDRATGRPVAPAIGWQDRRTAEWCRELREAGREPWVRAKTGLVLDPYFSAGKLRWLLEEIPGARDRAGAGEWAFGTVDSWLIWNLTGGRTHATDPGNASRTQLFGLHRLAWDEELLGFFGVPAAVLPEVVPSSGVFGECDPAWFGAAIPVAGVAGDQQAALFGQACLVPGDAKNTYGTGCFLLMNTGARPVESRHGLLSTVGWRIGGEVSYALEGSVFTAGAAVGWLRDQLGILGSAREIEGLAASVPDSGGVCFVPALTGLGAPHWDAAARGAIFGLSRGSGKAHLARATLEAIAWQTRDVLVAMEEDVGTALRELRVDGGATENRLLMGLQADVLGVPVVRAAQRETTALGAAWLAGLGVGLWSGTDELGGLWEGEETFRPGWGAEERARGAARWRRAVALAREAGDLESTGDCGGR